MRRLLRMVVALHVAAVMLSTGAAAQPAANQATPGRTVPVNLFVTFGDSLADTGNVYTMTGALGFHPAVPPSVSPHRTYYEGRFTNGRVAFEYFWDTLRGTHAALQPVLRLGSVPRTGGIDFAFGGSGAGFTNRTPGGFLVPGLRGQVELFLALYKGKIPSRSLFAIVTGSNDYLTTPPAAPAEPAEVVGHIVAAIDALYARGARSVMVLNLSDLGAVPLVADAPQAQRDGLSALSAMHNAALASALQQLAASRTGLTIVPVDVAAVTTSTPPGMNLTEPAVDALVSAWPYPFPPSRCLFVDAATCTDVSTFDVGADYFFWDVLHPTEAVHRGLAQYLTTLMPRQ